MADILSCEDQILTSQVSTKPWADPKDGFVFNNKSGALATALRRTSTDLHLPVIPGSAKKSDTTSDRWTNGLGVTLEPLTGPARPTRKTHTP